jgi:hypothetical protein
MLDFKSLTAMTSVSDMNVFVNGTNPEVLRLLNGGVTETEEIEKIKGLVKLAYPKIIEAAQKILELVK